MISPHPNVLSRRDFLYAGVCAGFAAATLPITAWAITTSSDSLVAGSVEIPTEGGVMPGYRAMPKGKGPFPTVLVVHEIFGVHEHVQDLCRRLAKEGYCAIAPYLYFRAGDVTKLKNIVEIRSQILSKTDHQKVLTDLDSAVSWAKKSGSANVDRLFITGFCWGGTAVWEYAHHNPKVRAGAAWYGRLKGTQYEKQPLDLASELRVPVLGLYGGKDEGIPLEDVEKMRERLKQGKSRSEIVVYADAEHAFNADYRPSYHEKSAKDAWGKMLGWFKERG